MEPIDVVIVLKNGYAFRQIFRPEAYAEFLATWRESHPWQVIAIPDHESHVGAGEIAAVHLNRRDYFHLNDEG